ncbi:MAG: hypothetical protein Q7J72_04320 [Candidatus Omnitrophota bacterium]|nr:hypothetical protein [Candidatus Omnitrophota bacterium]
MFKKAISLIISFSLLFTRPVFAYTATLNLSGYLNQGPNLAVSDRFRPINLRYFSYQPQTNDFQILLDKGDYQEPSLHLRGAGGVDVLKQEASILLDYFKIGLSLPNDKFWVNLRPDSEDQIIDDELAKTDLGRVMLEADLKLKQDTALFTSPQTPQGKEYWNKLYKRAGELFGTENITIPTLTRPWIVPGEIILRESADSANNASGAYIYKANLKVMLEEDYLKNSNQKPVTGNQIYSFTDPRLKELNQYSTQLIRELILPKLTQKVNSSKDYANLRQVYFSLILARWFKETFKSSPQAQGDYLKLINSHNLTNLTSKQAWDKTTYFNTYQKSFKEGEYNLSEPIYTPTGQAIRRYMSGGVNIMSGSPLEGRFFNKFKKGKDFLKNYMTTMKKYVIFTFFANEDTDTELVSTENTDIEAYIVLKMLFSSDAPVKNFDKLINIFRNAEATLVFEGKKDFLSSIAIVLKDLTKNDEFNLGEIRKILKNKLEDLLAVYGKEMRSLINSKELTSFFTKNYDFRNQITAFLDKNEVIPAAEHIYGRIEDIFNTNTMAARDLIFTVMENALKIRDILNGEKEIFAGSSPLSLEEIKSRMLPFMEEYPKIGRNPSYYRLSIIAAKIKKTMNTEDDISKWDAIQKWLIQMVRYESEINRFMSTYERKGLLEPFEKREMDGYFTRNDLISAANKLSSLAGDKLQDAEMRWAFIHLAKDIRQFMLFGTVPEDSLSALSKIQQIIDKRPPSAQPQITPKDTTIAADTGVDPITSSSIEQYKKLIEQAFTNYENGGRKLPEYLQTARDEIQGLFGHSSLHKLLTDTAVLIRKDGSLLKSMPDIYLVLTNSATAIENDIFDSPYRHPNPSVLSAPEDKTSSALATTAPTKTGGIDFRQMNILTKPMGSFSGLNFNLPMLSKAEVESLDLDKELTDIQRMVNSGIVPSGNRLKEYLSACYQKGEFDSRREGIIVSLVEICNLEESLAVESDPALREALVMAEWIET